MHVLGGGVRRQVFTGYVRRMCVRHAWVQEVGTVRGKIDLQLLQDNTILHHVAGRVLVQTEGITNLDGPLAEV